VPAALDDVVQAPQRSRARRLGVEGLTVRRLDGSPHLSVSLSRHSSLVTSRMLITHVTKLRALPSVQLMRTASSIPRLYRTAARPTACSHRVALPRGGRRRALRGSCPYCSTRARAVDHHSQPPLREAEPPLARLAVDVHLLHESLSELGAQLREVRAEVFCRSESATSASLLFASSTLPFSVTHRPQRGSQAAGRGC
jgi:hypothetical protein